MPDTSAPLTSFSAGEAARHADDPLAGDWSAGLPAPVRAHSIPEPRRIVLDGKTPRGADEQAASEASLHAGLPDVSSSMRGERAAASPFPADPLTPAGVGGNGAGPSTFVRDPVAPGSALASFEAEEPQPPSFDVDDPAEWSEPVPSPAPGDVPMSEVPAPDVPMRDVDVSTSEWAMAAGPAAAEALDVAPADASAWIAAVPPAADALDAHADSAPTPWSEPVAAPASPAAWEVPLDATTQPDVPAWDAIPATPATLVPPSPPVIPPPVLLPSPPIAVAPPPVLAPAPPVHDPPVAVAPPVLVPTPPPVLVPSMPAVAAPPVLVPRPPPVLAPSPPIAAAPPVLVPTPPPVLAPSPPIVAAPPVLVPTPPPVLIPSSPVQDDPWLPAASAATAAPVEAAPATAWDAPPADAAPVPDTAWDAPPPPADSAPEWQPDTASSDWQQVKKPEAPSPEGAAADWSSLRSGPDWSASAAAPPDAAADAWGAAPPAADRSSEWAAPAAPAPAEVEWSPPPPAVEPKWSAPPAPVHAPAPEPSAPGPAWNAPAVGASALEQLDSEPPEPEPGAAKDLFGSVPAGGSLSGDDDEFTRYDGFGANGQSASPDALGPPVELASPEEVLRPLDDIDHDDPDLPAPVEKSSTTPARAQPLAAWRPAASGALEVRGEHRVAVHTRGGRTLRGSLRDIDLSKSQFPLLPQGGGGAESIYHSDVKAIFFMLAPGEKPHPGDGGKVRVTFADGRVIEGTREGADAKHGFFLVPLDAARTNTRRIYVAREATSNIENG